MKKSHVLRAFVIASLVSIAGFYSSDAPFNGAHAQEPCYIRGRGEVGTLQTTTRPFNRWALVIGVSRYQYGDQNISGRQISNLNYAETDAKNVYDFLLTPEGGGFLPGNIKLLKNEEANQKTVTEGLAWLRRVAEPNDYFVIFIASHGDVEERSGRQVPYFLVYDTDPRDFNKTAVRMDDFLLTIKTIKARRGLVLVDTCHSAGIVSGVRGGSNIAMKLLDGEMIKLTTGVGVLVSCNKDQKSKEDFGYGLFTRYVIEGLRSYADQNNDHIVRLSELVSYVQSKVPERARVMGVMQNPQYYNQRGADADSLPLSIIGALPAARSEAPKYGAMVIRVPELSDVEVAIDGCSIGKVGKDRERIVRATIGEHNLVFTKDQLKLEEPVKVEPEESTTVEVNLAFSRSDQRSFVPLPHGQTNIYLQGKQSPEAALKLIQEGIARFDRQDFKAASDKFNSAVAAGGGSEALVYLGRAQQSLGLKDAAIVTYNRALELKPTDYQTRALLAEAQFNKGQNTIPIERTLREIIEQHPRYEFPYAVLGDLLFARGDRSNAILWLRRAINVNPGYAPAYLILANVLIYEDPEKTFVEGENIVPAHPLKDAVTYAEKALELFEEISKKEVSVGRGLQHLSISHVIFGGGRYINKEVFAEAHYMVAKARNQAISDPGLTEPAKRKHLEEARTQINKARTFADKMTEKHRLALVLGVSAENYFHLGNFPASIKDAKAAIEIIEGLKKAGHASLIFTEAETRMTLSKAYEARQDFCLAHDNRKFAFEVIKSRLNETKRKNLEAEVAKLGEMCTLHRGR